MASYHCAGNVTELIFNVTARDGKTKKDYKLLIVKGISTIKNVKVNGNDALKQGDKYYYQVKPNASAADVTLTASSTAAKVKIAGNAEKIHEDTVSVKLNSVGETVVPLVVSTYPFTDDMKVNASLIITKQDNRLNLSSVLFKPESQNSAREVEKDSKGDYYTLMPAADTKGQLTVVANSSDVNLKLYKVGNPDPRFLP